MPVHFLLTKCGKEGIVEYEYTYEAGIPKKTEGTTGIQEVVGPLPYHAKVNYQPNENSVRQGPRETKGKVHQSNSHSIETQLSNNTAGSR